MCVAVKDYVRAARPCVHEGRNLPLLKHSLDWRRALAMVTALCDRHAESRA